MANGMEISHWNNQRHSIWNDAEGNVWKRGGQWCLFRGIRVHPFGRRTVLGLLDHLPCGSARLLSKRLGRRHLNKFAARSDHYECRTDEEVDDAQPRSGDGM